ncbi:unnamed protein product [Symbiodinium microadriaticum]|nr:unnamed protein product [Symbiodinium microadriaticum]
MGSTDNTCALDVPDAPDILTYPKYYIMNEEKTKLIHSATICKDRGIDLCEEVMPYDGHFYFRLAGIEPIGDKATWKFCDREGGIDTELEFRMKKGHCIPMAQTTAKKYCDGLETVTTISATIFLTGATATDLSAADSRLLEDDMSALIPLAERATFEAVFVSQSKAMTHDVVQNAIQTIRNELEVGMTSGSFVSELKNAINLVPNSADDVLRKVDGASLLEVDIATEYYQPIGTGLYVTSPDQDTIPSSTTEHHEQGTDSTVSSTVIVFAGGVAGVVLAAAAFMVFNKRTTHTLLPNDSTH